MPEEEKYEQLKELMDTYNDFSDAGRSHDMAALRPCLGGILSAITGRDIRFHLDGRDDAVLKKTGQAMFLLPPDEFMEWVKENIGIHTF